MASIDPLPMPGLWRRLLGLGLLLSAAMILGAILSFWPCDAGSGTPAATLPGGRTMPRETDLLLLALLFGALGSFVHVAKSFTSFAGNRTLVGSWLWWYCLQPMVGMALALVFYVVVRGGFFASASGAGAVSPYGIAGTSGLVGMFSKQATDKLNELFSTLFQTAADAGRKDK